MKNSTKKSKKFFSTYELIFLIISWTIGIVLTIILKPSFYVFMTMFFGIAIEVFFAKKSLWVCFLNLIANVFYCIVSWNQLLWGEFFVVLIFYIPMIFIQYFFWKKKMKGGELPTYSIGWWKTVIVIVSCFIISFAFSFLLKNFGDPVPLLDAISVVFTITMTIMGLLRHNECWIIWFIAVIVDIAIWISVQNYVVAFYFFVALINIFYGFYKWKKGLQDNNKSVRLSTKKLKL